MTSTPKFSTVSLDFDEETYEQGKQCVHVEAPNAAVIKLSSCPQPPIPVIEKREKELDVFKGLTYVDTPVPMIESKGKEVNTTLGRSFVDVPIPSVR